MTAKTIAALQQLDPKNDAHWTSDGLPRLETVRLFAGDASLTREALAQVAPGFTRARPTLQTSAGAADSGQGVQGTSDPAIAAPAAAQPGAIGEGSDVAAVQGAGTGDKPDDEAEPGISPAQAAIQAARARVDEASAAKAKADQEHSQAVATLDAALDAAVRAGAQETLADQVGSYHKRQLEALQQRANLRQQLRTAGVDLKELARMSKASALDQAFARKNSRGTARPTPRK
jgi:hypothetical protein